MSKERQQVADVLSERSTVVRIGVLHFRVKPVTLAQIYDLGAVISDINADGLTEKQKINVIAEITEHYKDAQCMLHAALVILFRSPIKRKFFRRYIFRKMRIQQFQQLINYVAKSFDANFFLTSIIFLRRIAEMTEPSQMTAHGLSSEE